MCSQSTSERVLTLEERELKQNMTIIDPDDHLGKMKTEIDRPKNGRMDIRHLYTYKTKC